MSFEVCFKRRKWFLVYMYKPPKVSDECAWGGLSQLADNFVDSSNLTIFFGDINYDMFKDNILRDICDVYDLKNTVHGPTCFKGENPTLLDVFLTNKPNSFCNFINIDTGISDFHNLTGSSQKSMLLNRTDALSHIGPWNILTRRNLQEISAPYLSMFVIFLMMLMILYGPSQGSDQFMNWIGIDDQFNSIQHELNWNWIERFWIGIELELKASTDRNWSIQSIHFQFNSSFYKVKLFLYAILWKL